MNILFVFRFFPMNKAAIHFSYTCIFTFGPFLSRERFPEVMDRTTETVNCRGNSSNWTAFWKGGMSSKTNDKKGQVNNRHVCHALNTVHAQNLYVD